MEFIGIEFGGRVHGDGGDCLGPHSRDIRQRGPDGSPASRISSRPRREIGPLVEHVRREDQIGDVFGVAISDAVEAQLHDANIEPGEGVGLIGGITGVLVNACYHADVPAAVLVVKANPYLPDPAAARSVIEDALEEE
jgi:hypothetical protein